MTVYLVQDTKWVDKDGKLRSKFDFSAAEQFGSIVELLPASASPFDLPPVIEALHNGLRAFNDLDYLLLVGSPVIIGCAVAIAADLNNGNVAMLQWHGIKRQYFPVPALGLFS